LGLSQTVSFVRFLKFAFEASPIDLSLAGNYLSTKRPVFFASVYILIMFYGMSCFAFL